MEVHIRDCIQAIRDQLDRADRQPLSEAQIGMTLIAVGQLTRLAERLYERIVDLERVQNERGETT